MSEVLKERKDMDKAFCWDLKSLYENDEAFEKALARLEEMIASLRRYRGTLKDAASVKAYLDRYCEVAREGSNVYGYSFLRKAEDIRDEKALSMDARAMARYVAFHEATSFEEPELLALPEETLKQIADDPSMEPYRYRMIKLLRKKEHVLSEAEETLLAGFGESFQLAKQVAESLTDADMLFAPARDARGNEHEVSQSGYIPLQMSSDRTLRKSAFESYYDTFRKHNNTLGAAYVGTLRTDAAMAKARKFASARALAMSDENIPAEVYDNLIATVRKHLPTMYRYVDFRKRMLQVDDVHYYDVYAPLAKGDRKSYSYEEAQRIVLEAVAPLGEEYVNTVKGAFTDGWIDVYPNKGKISGAFSAGTYDSNPYILLNFKGTLDAVSTIAHEMGHSMHSWYSNRAQNYLNAQYSIFVAEVASTVNENLMIEMLLKQTTDPAARMALLDQYLENFKGTIFRQTMFAEFEHEAHAMQERGEAPGPASLNRLYEGLVRDYFGKEMVIDDEVQYEWSRIPHFYRPFYVYKYATGYATATALSEMIRREGAPAVKRYLEFLSLGGSCDPIDALKHAGVDLTTPAPIEASMEKLASVLDDAERTAKEL